MHTEKFVDFWLNQTNVIFMFGRKFLPVNRFLIVVKEYFNWLQFKIEGSTKTLELQLLGLSSFWTIFSGFITIFIQWFFPTQFWLNCYIF